MNEKTIEMLTKTFSALGANGKDAFIYYMVGQYLTSILTFIGFLAGFYLIWKVATTLYVDSNKLRYLHTKAGFTGYILEKEIDQMSEWILKGKNQ